MVFCRLLLWVIGMFMHIGTVCTCVVYFAGFPIRSRHHSFKKILFSIQKYYDVHHHCIIHRAYCFPHGDERYPKMLWGFKLGKLLVSLKWSGAYSEHYSGTRDVV